MKPHLIVREGTFVPKPDYEALTAKAAALFPESQPLQAGWIKARVTLLGVKPRVEIGRLIVDTVTYPRTLKEAGIYAIEQPYDVPYFLRWAR